MAAAFWVDQEILNKKFQLSKCGIKVSKGANQVCSMIIVLHFKHITDCHFTPLFFKSIASGHRK